jgi:hypothetical protein
LFVQPAAAHFTTRSPPRSRYAMIDRVEAERLANRGGYKNAVGLEPAAT